MTGQVQFYLAWRTAGEAAPRFEASVPGPTAGPLLGKTHVTMGVTADRLNTSLLDLTVTPALARVQIATAPGVLHFLRLADATLKPLPAEAVLTLARGDAYIALSPGAERLAGRVPIARFLHLRDYFNAERLAEGVLAFLAQVSEKDVFSEDVGVIVVEAR